MIVSDIQIPLKYANNSQYEIGSIELNNDHAKLITKNQNKKIFIDNKNLQGAYHGDIVVVKKIFNSRTRFKAKVIEVIKVISNDILCYSKNGFLFSMKEHIKLTKYHQDDLVGLLKSNSEFEILGKKNDKNIDEIISLKLYKQGYRNKKLENCDFSKYKFDDSKRVNLTHLPFCTIDPASAKDHDDAIYFDEEKYTLYVAIADVSAFVVENSELDIKAKQNAFSIYFPHKVLPMLPKELSENLCSLKPNVKRYAYVFQINIDKKTSRILESKLYEASIVSHKKYNYNRINRVLNNQFDQCDEIDKKIFSTLLQLNKITKKLKQIRLKNGYDFRSKEFKLNLDNNLKIKSVSNQSSSPSHELVEECMLLANTQAALKLNKKGIFRVHEEPTSQKINQLITNINLLGLKIEHKKTIHATIESAQKKSNYTGLVAEIDELIIKSQQQAHYCSSQNEHFGLGFSSYSHFTSPIRRYSDLILHRMLKNKNIPQNIDNICKNISNIERDITSCIWDFEDRKYARWASDNCKKIFTAKIINIESRIAQLTNGAMGAKIYLENYFGQKLFSELRIKIMSCDVLTKNITGKIIG